MWNIKSFAHLFFAVLLYIGCSDLDSNQIGNELSPSEIIDKLNQKLPKSIEIISVLETDIEGYFEVNFRGVEPLFISKDGKYLISGDIFEITNEGLLNRSESRRDYSRKSSLRSLDKAEFITFQPEQVKHSIFVFTDVDCGYCRMLHSEINDYLDLGIKVNYLAFPRAGIDSESFNKIASAWCSSEPNKAITELKLGYEIQKDVCVSNPVKKHFDLGNSLGVSGTPSIITTEGKINPGYIPAEELISLLNS